MFWNLFEKNRKLLENEHSRAVFREGSGISRDMLIEECRKIESLELPLITRVAKIDAFLLKNARLSVDPIGFFPDEADFEGITVAIRQARLEANRAALEKEIAPYVEGQRALAFTGDPDFGHSAPDWATVMKLGLPGLLDRVRAIDDSPEKRAFREASITVLEAAIAFVHRLYEEVLLPSSAFFVDKASLVASSLYNLTKGAPSTLLEAMQLTFIFYALQHTLEVTNVRTLGSLDSLYIKFYENDLASGKFSEENLRELIRYFLIKCLSKNVAANIPFALGGRDKNGNTKVNALSYIILEEYSALGIHDPKIHLRVHPGIDERFLRQALRSIIDGSNSIVFINDETVEKALVSIGEEEIDARDYSIVGCYEACSTAHEVACTCNGRVNLPKAVEAAIFNGIDPLTGKRISLPTGEASEFATFDDFMCAVEKQIEYFSLASRKITCAYERFYPSEHASLFYSITLDDCVSRGLDAYISNSVKYNNSSINAFGTATAADSLYAIKRAVYEDKILTLPRLAEILASNWQGEEKLRREFLHDYTKYGNNSEEPDSLAAWLVRVSANTINGKPNARGGVFRCGTFSIDWRIAFGAKTCASADGRLFPTPLSKNICCDTARDREGVTSHILSALRIDTTETPNGSVLDLTLDSSAVSGTDGEEALLGTLRVFMLGGGFAIQYNVLDPETLRRAQREPENFKTLQVRLCGWNALFINLSELEQNEFIAQLEAC